MVLGAEDDAGTIDIVQPSTIGWESGAANEGMNADFMVDLSVL